MTSNYTEPDLLARIEQTLDSMRPYIASHRGSVEVVDFDETQGILLLRLGGPVMAARLQPSPSSRGSRSG
jgi:Fe-S cluster biogenesis protein NfuA